jgi:hypothetical protein
MTNAAMAAHAHHTRRRRILMSDGERKNKYRDGDQ